VNVLYLCHRIPYPPDKGDKIRSFHQIQALSRSHRLHMACLIDAEEDRRHVAALEPYCASVNTAYRGTVGSWVRMAGALLGAESLSVAAFRSADLARRVNRVLKTESIDAAIVFSSVMAQYLPQGTNLPTIVDFCDVDSEKWKVYADVKPWPVNLLYRIEAGRLRRYERKLARIHDESVFAAENEAEVFRAGEEGMRARGIASGVDLEFFAPPPNGAPYRADARALVFVGVMDYFPNVDAACYFADQILPRIQDACPDAVFQIVGRNPSRRVRDLARRKNVEVTGRVPDVRPYVAGAAVSVAPFRVARGIQNKVLEAMAMAVPVVGTPFGFQGVAAGPDDGVRIEESPESFARAVTAFLADPALRKEEGMRGRRFVERHHRWQDHDAALEALLQEVVARRGARVPHAGGRR